MLQRVFRRALLSAWTQPRSFLLPNLVCDLALMIAALIWVLAVGFWGGSDHWSLTRLVMIVLTLAWIWLALSSLAFAMARRMSGRTAGWQALRSWLKLRWRERLLAFLLTALALVWCVLGFVFYQNMAASSPWLSLAGMVFSGILGLLTMMGSLVNLALAARHEEIRPKAEWKVAFLLALAFFPFYLLGIVALLLASGAGAFWFGFGSFWARLLWAPALFLPVGGLALLLSFWVALNDEFLAKALGQGPSEQGPFPWRELLQPWR